MARALASPRMPSDCDSCPLRRHVFYLDGVVDDDAALLALRQGCRSLPAKATIYREGELASEYFTLFDGWAFRYKLIPDGRRQILSFLLPGDAVSFLFMRTDRLHFSVQALTDVSLCVFSRIALARHVTSRSDLSANLERLEGREIAAADDRLTDLGRRSAHERVANLILQLHLRLQQRGLAEGDSFPFPLRQQHLGDALGLTAVHVSRVLKDLKSEGLVSIERERLTLHDAERMRRLYGLNERSGTDRYLL